MGLLRRGGRRPGQLRTGDSSDLARLTEFAKTRTGVEAYLEPPTTVTAMTVVLVASDGEWTRRRVADAKAAASFAKKQAIPLYDAGIVGYPQRMRDWTARQKRDDA